MRSTRQRVTYSVEVRVAQRSIQATRKNYYDMTVGTSTILNVHHVVHLRNTLTLSNLLIRPLATIINLPIIELQVCQLDWRVSLAPIVADVISIYILLCTKNHSIQLSKSSSFQVGSLQGKYSFDNMA